MINILKYNILSYYLINIIKNYNTLINLIYNINIYQETYNFPIYHYKMSYFFIYLIHRTQTNLTQIYKIT